MHQIVNEPAIQTTEKQSNHWLRFERVYIQPVLWHSYFNSIMQSQSILPVYRIKYCLNSVEYGTIKDIDN